MVFAVLNYLFKMLSIPNDTYLLIPYPIELFQLLIGLQCPDIIGLITTKPGQRLDYVECPIGSPFDDGWHVIYKHSLISIRPKMLFYCTVILVIN